MEDSSGDLGQPKVPVLSHDPVSKNPPTAADLASSAKLVEYLDRVAPLSSTSDTEQRKRVLAELQNIISTWLHKYYTEKLGLSKEEAAAPDLQCRLYVSGSYRLGVSTPGGDIDALVVAPAPVERFDFFDSLPKDLIAHAEVQRAHPIPNINVPIIEVEMGGIEIDLLFAQLATPTIPKDFDLLNDEILKGVDSPTAKSLNGPRVNELIIKHLVPADWETFKVCLRAVRHWFRMRGLYSNKMGFLGGVNFAILVTAVSQLFPRAAPCSMVQAFFRVFSTWEWRDQPVYVCQAYSSPIGLEQWGDNPEDNAQYMKIITPAYPVSNSSYNVTRFTLEVMEQELQRACKIVDSILAKEPESQDWGELFQPSDFFVRYDKYLGIKVSALSKEDHAQLSGYVESQVRRLLYFMEGMPLKGACPWHKGLTEQKAFSIDAEEDEDFDALRAQPGVPLRTEHAEGGGAGDAAGVEKKEGEGAVGAEGSTNAPAKEEGTKAPLQSPEVIVKQENGVAADTITASQVKQEGGTAPAAAAGAGGGGVEASENGSQAKLDTKPQAAAASAASGKASAAGGGEEEEKELVAMEYMTTFFMGLEVDRSYVKRGMRLNLEPAVRSFLASVNVKTPEDAEVAAHIIPWSQLPDAMFPQGKEAAKQQWKKARRERRRSAASEFQSFEVAEEAPAAAAEEAENVIPGLSVAADREGAVPELPSGKDVSAVAGVAAGDAEGGKGGEEGAGTDKDDPTLARIRQDVESKKSKALWPALESAARKRMRVVLAH